MLECVCIYQQILILTLKYHYNVNYLMLISSLIQLKKWNQRKSINMSFGIKTYPNLCNIQWQNYISMTFNFSLPSMYHFTIKKH